MRIRLLSGTSLDLFYSDSDQLLFLYEKICGCTSNSFADLGASPATGVYMVHGVWAYVWCVHAVQASIAKHWGPLAI